MECSLVLKTWHIVKDEKTKALKIAGTYLVMLPTGKELASEAFNDGYQSKEIAFSPELMADVVAIEDRMKAEMEKILS